MLSAIPTLLVVITFVFLATRLIGGDPVRAILGEQGGSAEQVTQLRHQLGLDRPLWEQYVAYWGDVLRGDLGTSLITGRPVLDAILLAFPFTLKLAIAALSIGIAVGVPLGVAAAVRRSSAMDYVSMAIALVGMSSPAFFLAVLLIMLFSVQLQWLPVTGAGQAGDVADELKHIAMPAITLGMFEAALIARICRSSMLDFLHADFVLTARSKGLRERVVVFRHVLRNALLPVVAIVAIDLGNLLGGAVILETVFSRPGIGTVMVNGMFQRDYPTVQGTIAFAAMVIIFVNVAFDVVYAFLDPRIRFGEGS